jgi:hypothetical protein
MNESLLRVIQALQELEEDSSVPKNLKLKISFILGKSIPILSDDGERKSLQEAIESSLAYLGKKNAFLKSTALPLGNQESPFSPEKIHRSLPSLRTSMNPAAPKRSGVPFQSMFEECLFLGSTG